MIVLLGNNSPVHKDVNGEDVGPSVTEVRLADDTSLIEALKIIADDQGVWKAHSHDEAPTWVEGDNQALVDLLRANYKCGAKPADTNVDAEAAV